MNEDSIVLFCTYLSLNPRKAIGSIWNHYIPTGEKKKRYYSLYSPYMTEILRSEDICFKELCFDNEPQ